jgi:hypothetical protein
MFIQQLKVVKLIEAIKTVINFDFLFVKTFLKQLFNQF